MRALIMVTILVGISLLSGCAGKNDSSTTPDKVASGYDQGNGGDNLPTDHAVMWFTGARTVSFCIERDVTFPHTDTEVESLLLKAADTWKAYFDERIAKGPVNPITGKNIYSNPDNWPSFEMKRKEKCDETTDLTLYLGVEDPKVKSAKHSYADPIAFAHRTKYDAQKGWGQGFIWVAPKGPNFPWKSATKPFQLLYGMLLHELGHIYGCGHVPGTIMREKIGELLYSAYGSHIAAEEYVLKIDHSKELVLSELPNLKVTGLIYGEPCRVVYEKGCESESPAELKYLSKNILQLEFKGSDPQTVSIQLEDEEIPSRFTMGDKLFKIYYNMSGKPYMYFYAQQYGEILHGKMLTSLGKTLPILFERNSDTGGEAQIRLIGGPANKYPLFRKRPDYLYID